MTVFAEPSVTLCGRRAETAYAVCVREAYHDGDCNRYPFLEVVQRLNWTFTPCRWRFSVRADNAMSA
jgi:hypothetical protein